MPENTYQEGQAQRLSSAWNSTPFVAICIPTFKRPQGLRRLTESLRSINLAGIRVHIIVVDNDVEESGREVVTALQHSLPTPVSYAVEPVRGVASVRNRLVQMALDLKAEFIAFLDDDEWVDQNWLLDLTSTCVTLDADGAAGPVIAIFHPGISPWLTRTPYYHHFAVPLHASLKTGLKQMWSGQRHKKCQTGDLVGYCGAGNLLLRSNLLEKFYPPFDTRFDRTGGEDTHFLRMATRSGARIVWCDKAVAYEEVPCSRGTGRWLIRRAFRSGSTFSRSIVLSGDPRLRRLCSGIVNIGLGTVMLPAGAIHSKEAGLDAVLRIARGAGAISGLVGIIPRHYSGRSQDS